MSFNAIILASFASMIPLFKYMFRHKLDKKMMNKIRVELDERHAK